jgi:hypothetical protein
MADNAGALRTMDAFVAAIRKTPEAIAKMPQALAPMVKGICDLMGMYGHLVKRTVSKPSRRVRGI